MLKTQFVKAFYLCNSFLVISTTFAANEKASSTVPYVPKGMESAALKTAPGISKNRTMGNSLYLTHKSASFLFNGPQIKLNRSGMLFVRTYIKNSLGCLVSIKRRSLIPFSIIDSVFNRYGLPVELKYLAVIESELKPSALSLAGARGPWQLMPGTAEDLGLKITNQYDERVNYYKSTKAAAKYLKDLYAQFNDWLLVLAAYNGGPGAVYTAMRESGSKNFWILQNYLPAESREHVKKFIATHYYFEGRGGETTLTRAENKLAVSYNLKQKMVPGKDVINTNPPEPQRAVVQHESSEQKFNRLMNESEQSLKRSGKLI